MVVAYWNRSPMKWGIMMKVSVTFMVDSRTVTESFDDFGAATDFYFQLCERHGIENVKLVGAGGGIVREKGRLKE